jgi:small subunit ribosomal protein S1
MISTERPIIEIARSAGWCFGVERIVEMAEKLLNETHDGPVYCLGELIHNPQEVARLRAKGMIFVKSHEELPPLEPGQKGKVLIRAHGVAPAVKRALHQKGYEIYDGTCPLVTIPQRFARELAEQGYRVVIMGHIEHPEIQGILGHLEGLNAQVDVITGPDIEDASELKGEWFWGKKRIGISAGHRLPRGLSRLSNRPSSS